MDWIIRSIAVSALFVCMSQPARSSLIYDYNFNCDVWKAKDTAPAAPAPKRLVIPIGYVAPDAATGQQAQTPRPCLTALSNNWSITLSSPPAVTGNRPSLLNQTIEDAVVVPGTAGRLADATEKVHFEEVLSFLNDDVEKALLDEVRQKSASSVVPRFDISPWSGSVFFLCLISVMLLALLKP